MGVVVVVGGASWFPCLREPSLPLLFPSLDQHVPSGPIRSPEAILPDLRYTNCSRSLTGPNLLPTHLYSLPYPSTCKATGFQKFA